ncbi:D-2-hydroxyglutarate dehydrogenase YdiJ [Aliidiomarina celeris]|uniref:D-2-hydroxyglutarate dehydrogenase YdiJ n=1 Tax=Aliidiomarina celeris TaxID=2249428 RepID=UPI000DEAA2E2|nr:FAD-binding and (Fe-S)-binding domain-containing protein [Aliidiomarina celeris]
MTHNPAVRVPVAKELPKVAQHTQAFLDDLSAAGYIGDIDVSYGGRLVAATDNSIYQQLPQAVLYPKSQNDLACLLRVASQPSHQQVRFSPRGGGTGTNGQSLTPGVVIDLSRYLTRILELNLKEGWVRVEAGVVKDALNEYLAPHGFFFAPDTSTSNRATIGGMIGTDASGQGSLVYGKTSNHVVSLRSYLVTGELLESQPIPRQQAESKAKQQSTEGRLYQQVLASCVEKRAEIEAKFPPLNRFLTGYDLQHCWNAEADTIDLSRLLTGAEGTLAVVAEAKLRITPIPRKKVLVNVKYQDFQAALRHAPALVKARATSVETVDSNVLNLARKDIVWNQVSDLLTDVDGYTMNGINMVEFTALDSTEILTKLKDLTDTLDACDPAETGVIGYQVCNDAASIQKIYGMRKKAVGLLAATPGKRKPIAFAEDTAVPPEKLADFIMEFRALLDAENLHYGMFGHVDAGVLHVRPALNMQDEADEALVRKLSDQVMALTAKYGGLMWGEHGKGYRSEYGPEFFGEELFAELRKLKSAFDPENRLNPGKICTPWESRDALVSVDARKRGWYDKQIPLAVQEQWQGPMDCNGNGLCFNYDATTPMCPSYRGTKDRRYSPKGRATLLREWLRQVNSSTNQESDTKPFSWLRRQFNSLGRSQDFAHEVRDSMDSCLSCKACANQCPVSVDIPTYKSRFYAHYFSRYARPLKDYLVRDAERVLPRLARRPRLANTLMRNALAKWLQARWVGYVDTPEFAVPSTESRLSARRNSSEKLLYWHEAKPNARDLDMFDPSPFVALVPDVFTWCYEPQLVEAFCDVAERLGKTVVVLPFFHKQAGKKTFVNGKGMHVKGFLPEFKQEAEQSAALLNEVHDLGIPLVGLDAATTLCFKDEYGDMLGEARGRFHVQLVQDWLAQVLPAQQSASRNREVESLRLLVHCTEQTQAPGSKNTWKTLFEQIGVSVLTPNTGCCGMAGSYGHEASQKATSQRIFELNWQNELRHTDATPVATGFSCRCQSERFGDKQVEHPLLAFARRLS